MKPILVAFDKFKNSMTASNLCRIVNSQLSIQRIPSINIPLSDGGDGFIETLEYNLRLQPPSLQKVTGPLGEKLNAPYIINDKTAYIEAAQICGLSSVPKNKRNAFQATSKGIGEMALFLKNKGASNIIIGVGGSANMDMGIGALFGMGLKIKTSNWLKESDIPFPEMFPFITDISSNKLLEGVKISIASDVNTPLLGPNGAIKTYGPQKGISWEGAQLLEAQFTRLVKLIEAKTGINVGNLPKGGASGGIVAGLSAYTSTELLSGIDYISGITNLEESMKKCQAVITGEGCYDNQTFEGKVISKIFSLAEKYNKKVLVICGMKKTHYCPSYAKIVDFETTFGPKDAFVREPTLRELVDQNIMYLKS